MNNLYHKLAIASLCTALSFALGENKEAKAATITLRNPHSFFVFDNNNDGLGDGAYGNVPLPVGESRNYYELPRWGDVEFKALYEFNIASLSLTSNTIITQAIFQTNVNSWGGHFHYFTLSLWGYKGNGGVDYSDFEAGTYLDHRQLREGNPDLIFNPFNIDVTPFVNELVNNNDTFAGFNISAHYGGAYLSQDASLIITTADITEPVPEPTTIFGSVVGLCLGGWLKRKKSTLQNKTTSQG
jgi:hypothetical protein